MFERRTLYAKMRRKLSVLPVSLAFLIKKRLKAYCLSPGHVKEQYQKKQASCSLFYRTSYLFNLQGQNLANFKTLIAIENSKTINFDSKKGRNN